MGVLGGVVALVVILIGALVWVATRGDDLQAVGSANTLPEGGGVTVGPGVDADVTQVRVYEDFQCPVCKQFEQVTGPLLKQQVESGAITLVYRPFSFLDENGGSPNDYSKRATNAAIWRAANRSTGSPPGMPSG